jgi:hypothetical protein
MGLEWNIWHFSLDLSFRRCQAKLNIYCLKIQELFDVFFTLYVDDLLIFSKDLKVIERVKKSLSQEFEMKDWWEFEYFLKI